MLPARFWRLGLAAVLAICLAGVLHWTVSASRSGSVSDRPRVAATPARLEVEDHGIVFEHGRGPDACDILGARDATIFEENGTYYLGYDGAGPEGWLGCLATSKDLVHWDRHGPILTFALAGEGDRRYAGYPLIRKAGDGYRMYYVGAAATTGMPWQVPAIPYTSHAARARTPFGPWLPAPELAAGLDLGPAGSFDDQTVVTGPTFEHQGKTWMIVTVAGGKPLRRTLALAWREQPGGPWRKSSQPILPPEEQVENAALYFEKASQSWFLFTNHVGIHDGFEYADAIWVYWSSNPLDWDARNKAIVLDRHNVNWKHPRGNTAIIGLPAVIEKEGKLLIFYDGLAGSARWLPAGDGMENCHRDIGMASLKLPLVTPQP
jgi:predicted GH43/DUF377 family glycosyl hydrolase